MNYKLIGSNDFSNVQNTIFENRDIKDIKHYVNLSSKDEIPYSYLDNMQKAVECLEKHIAYQDQIDIVVDSDVDGYTSASILYMYIKKQWGNDYPITYSIHQRKTHGLSDDITIPKETKLVLLPDAGSNDIEQCKKLKSQNVDIIILDHHEIEKENPYAIVVNNQSSNNYSNKNLSGVGIVYKFLQAIDEEEWTDYANDYLDLVALGNISDSMDIREYETKYLIEKGLHNIQHPFFKELLNKNSYSISNIDNPTINDVQFYITPYINSLIRCGEQKDKENLFKAFIQDDSQTFEHTKRGSTESTQENIYEHMARICTNCHSKQNRTRDKSVPTVVNLINKRHHDKDKVILCNISDSKVPQAFTGLIAMNVAEQIGKPCLLLRYNKKRNDYEGSGRNIDNSYVENLKDLLQETGKFEYVSGHQSAFGASIKKENIKDAIQIINDKLCEVDATKTYTVDFVIDADDLDVSLIRDINNLKSYYGQGFTEPFVYVKNIEFNSNDIIVMGKNNNSWKTIINDDIAIIKFKCKEDDKILNIERNKDVRMDIVGKCSISEYKGIWTPQIIVSDYQLN